MVDAFENADYMTVFRGTENSSDIYPFDDEQEFIDLLTNVTI